MIKDCNNCRYEHQERCPPCRGFAGPTGWREKDREPIEEPSRPKVLILGHARHGKDTVAELLRDNHGFSFASSSLFAAEKVVRPALAATGVTYTSLEDCYADRVNHREFWYKTISEYNGGGKSRLAEEILEEHDCYVGMRSFAEYEASLELFDHVIWVSAFGRGLPAESGASFSIAYDIRIMDVIPNNGTLEDLAEAVARWVKEDYSG